MSTAACTGAAGDRQYRRFSAYATFRNRICGVVRCRQSLALRRWARPWRSGEPRTISARKSCGGSALGTPGTSPRTPISVCASRPLRAPAVATLDFGHLKSEEAPAYLTNWFGQRRRFGSRGWPADARRAFAQSASWLIRELGLVRALGRADSVIWRGARRSAWAGAPDLRALALRHGRVIRGADDLTDHRQRDDPCSDALGIRGRRC